MEEVLRCGVTPQYISDLSGVSPSTISLILRGLTSPTERTTAKIYQAISVIKRDMSAVVGGESSHG
jgi:transcriptional regulator with XRE-family HTH domain